MRSPVLISLTLFVLCVVPSIVFAQAVRPAAQSESDKIVEGAKQEGKLVVSIPASAELRRTLDEAFKKKFSSIEMELVTARGPSHAQKIVQEKKANINYYDVHVAGTSSIIAAGFVKEGLGRTSSSLDGSSRSEGGQKLVGWLPVGGQGAAICLSVHGLSYGDDLVQR